MRSATAIHASISPLMEPSTKPSTLSANPSTSDLSRPILISMRSRAASMQTTSIMSANAMTPIAIWVSLSAAASAALSAALSKILPIDLDMMPSPEPPEERIEPDVVPPLAVSAAPSAGASPRISTKNRSYSLVLIFVCIRYSETGSLQNMPRASPPTMQSILIIVSPIPFTAPLRAAISRISPTAPSIIHHSMFMDTF